MALEEASPLTVEFSKANSAMIKWMASATSSGKMDPSMKDSGLEEKNLERENSTGLMDRSMRENSKIMNAME